MGPVVAEKTGGNIRGGNNPKSMAVVLDAAQTASNKNREIMEDVLRVTQRSV